KLCSTSSRKGSQSIAVCAVTANGNASRLVHCENVRYVSIGFRLAPRELVATFRMQRDVGAPSRAVECDRTSAIAHSHVPLQQEHAVLAINGPGPKIGAAHGQRCDRRGDRDFFGLQLLDTASYEAHGATARSQRDFASAFGGTVDKAIDHDICVLAKR